MATTAPSFESSAPFPLVRATSASWREHALTRIAEQRLLLISLRAAGAEIPPQAMKTIEDQWAAAESAAKGLSGLSFKRIFSWFGGAAVERVTSQLDAVETALLRLAPPDYVLGELPGLLVYIQQHLPADDLRVQQLERLADDPTSQLTVRDRELAISARQAANVATRAEVTRLRSFGTVLLVTALVLALGAVGVGAFGLFAADKVPLCFTPDSKVVCPTSTALVPQKAPANVDRVDAAVRHQASAWDIPLVEGIGLIAAAAAAAISLRGMRGTPAPYSLPVSLAVLKLPLGALTAALGLVLMRGGFVPGLSALDSSGQIISWAVVLGYSQQLFTQFIDKQAQTVLANFGRAVGTDQRQRTADQAKPT